jgi:ankyrin repeat protein
MDHLKQVRAHQLFDAIERGCSRDVALALRQGADPDAVVFGDYSSMRMAARKGALGAIRAMIPHANPDARDPLGRTLAMQGRQMPDKALALAIEFCDMAATDANGLTALHWAVLSGRSEVLCAQMLDQGPPGLADARDRSGRSPALIALRSGKWPLAEAVLRHSEWAAHDPDALAAARHVGVGANLEAWIREREKALLDRHAAPAPCAKPGPRL